MKRGTRDRLAFIAVAFVMVAVGVYLVRPDGSSSAGEHTVDAVVPSSTTATTAVAATDGPVGPLQAALSKEIDEALAATSYPELRPTMRAVLSGPVALSAFEACAVARLAPDGRCQWGSPYATHLMYVVGDSTSTVYAQALAEIVKSTGEWKMRYQGMAGCRFSSVTFSNKNLDLKSSCPKHNDAVVADIRRLHPDMVVVTNDEGNELADGSKLTIPGVMAALETELAKVQPSTTDLVLLEQPPLGHLRGCYHGSDPAECLNDASSTVWPKYGAALRTLAEKVGATYIDAGAWFCNRDLHCPAFVGTTPTMHDHVHASTAYATRLAPVIAEAMRGAELPI